MEKHKHLQCNNVHIPTQTIPYFSHPHPTHATPGHSSHQKGITHPNKLNRLALHTDHYSFTFDDHLLCPIKNPLKCLKGANYTCFTLVVILNTGRMPYIFTDPTRQLDSSPQWAPWVSLCPSSCTHLTVEGNTTWPLLFFTLPQACHSRTSTPSWHGRGALDSLYHVYMTIKIKHNTYITNINK